MPAIFITDPRVKWEAVDEHTALLVVPFGEVEERFVVRFDPTTDLPLLFSALRFREHTDDTKTLWISEAGEWGVQNNRIILILGSLTWLGDRGPWAEFAVEEIVYNVDVEEYIVAKGL